MLQGLAQSSVFAMAGPAERQDEERRKPEMQRLHEESARSVASAAAWKFKAGEQAREKMNGGRPTDPWAGQNAGNVRGS